MSESRLLPAHVLLDFQQRKYAYRILSLPNSILTKNILPFTLQIGDRNAQLEDVSEYDSIWLMAQCIKNYSQHLAQQVSVGFSINPAEGVELISAIPAQVFLRQIFIKEKNRAVDIAKNNYADLTLWCDRFKLNQGGAGTALVWKENRQSNEWITQKIILGKNKEIFDVEIWDISEAVKVAEKKSSRVQQPLAISIFCDSQTAINRLKIIDSKTGQALKS